MAILIAENTLKPLSPVNTMSSTSNVQNLLTNVFRPVFVYDATNGVYQSKLELTNVDAVSANIVYTFAAAVGDSMGNVYVGINSGNPNSLLAIKANSNSTFVGKESGSGSTSNTESVFIGYRAGASAVSSSYSISIGANAKSGGISNVFIGNGAGITSGSNNIFIGPGVTNGGTAVNNKLLIGSGSTTTFMVGDLSGNRVGINLSSLTPYTTDTRLVVNGFTRIGGTTNNGKLAINTTPETFDLDVNGTQRIQDGVGTLTFSNGIQTSTGGFNSTTSNLTTVSSGTFLYTIGSWKKGNVLITSRRSDNNQYVSSMYFCANETTPTIVLMSGISNTSNGSYPSLTIQASGTNIQLSNSGASTPTGTYYTSITYFPVS